ncbi:MAG: NADH-quinone oxidoreductase subunit J [Anaerolineae bacterium]|nr:NADH-quinone oxidoreductase subunit J [Anaerolineae bacterium]
MTEASLFLIVGIIAIASAVAMLLSSNAVHSALFLVVVMGCIAFLFLMLDAPFLFLVQITVYAGAIMVLFLFVIMFLSAERMPGKTSLFRWMTPLAVVLALVFLTVAAITLGQVSTTEIAPSGAPLVRIGNFATEAGPVDVYANNELIAADVDYGTTTDFETLPAGEYNLALFTAGTQDALVAQTVVLEPGTVTTALAYGESTPPQVALVDNNLATVASDGDARVSFFNAYGEDGISLADTGSEFDTEDTSVLLGPVAFGASSDSLDVNARDNMSTWAFIDEGGTVVFPLSNTDVFELDRDTLEFLVLAQEPTFEGTTRPRAFSLDTGTLPAFGSPVSVGRELFTRYMLPMQMVAVLLLVAMIGAIVLTHKPDYKPRKRRDERRKVSRPLTSVIAAQTGHDVVTASGQNSVEKLPEPVAEPQVEQ